MHWSDAASSTDTSVELLLHRLVHEHHLTRLAQQPIRELALLDLIFVSLSLESSQVVDLPPIADCNHCAQQLLIYSSLKSVKSKLRNFVNYERLVSLLSQIVWAEVFAGCSTTNNYASCFTSVLISAIQTSSTIKPVHKRAALPKHTVQLIKQKKRLWLKAKRVGDFTALKLVRRDVQAAIQHHHKNQEQWLVYKACRKEFFKYVVQ